MQYIIFQRSKKEKLISAMKWLVLFTQLFLELKAQAGEIQGIFEFMWIAAFSSSFIQFLLIISLFFILIKKFDFK